MTFNIPSNGLPFTLLLEIKTRKPEEISIIGSNADKPDTFYISRNGDVNNSRLFELKFPQTPRLMELSVFNTKRGEMGVGRDGKPLDTSFQITKFEATTLKTYPLWSDEDIISFVKFAKFFCENASVIEAGDFKPTSVRSDDGKFAIDYYQKIRNRKTGGFVSTPARIGHLSGTIEISKSDFVKYTIPMRMVILLHEFSHKYMNPKIGKEISDEVSADINALNIYLSLGYPHIEAQYAFLKVFRGANNDFNKKRYLILDDFIKKFIGGDLENKRTLNHNLNSARKN